MSFWSTSTAAPLDTTGTAEVGGGDLEPIPSKTVVRVIATEATWEANRDNDIAEKGGRHIKIRWDVIDGEYKKRVVFQKIWAEHTDAKKRDKAIQMLAAIDANAGGKLLASGAEPTDMTMMQHLCNKPMLIRVMVWETENNEGETIRGNWVNGVYNAAAMQPGKPAAAPKPAAKPAGFEDFDDDIPF